MAGGRPSKYKDEFCDKMIEYFDRKPFDRDILVTTKKNGEEEERIVETACDFPLISGFANEIGVTRETLHDWSTAVDDKGELKHPEFSYAYKRAKQYQEVILVTNGLRGNYQPVFSIFTAKNVLGYRDKQETDSDLTPDETLTLKRIAQAEMTSNL